MYRASAFAIALSFCTLAANSPKRSDTQLVEAKTTHAVTPIALSCNHETPQRIILMVGDGMGTEQLALAHIANKGKLYMELLPMLALLRTTSASNAITDSAAAATAFATGHKTPNGRLGLDAKGQPNPSLFELAKAKGMATGLVVTKAVTDATPAAFYAKVMKRTMRAQIAAQLLGAGVNVVVGGGRAHFNPEQLKQLEAQTGLLAWLAEGDAPYAAKRGPVLERYTSLALDYLHRSSPKGFFVLIEGSTIDPAGHANEAGLVADEMLDFDRAVGAAMRWVAAHPRTLLIVCSDHATGGLVLVDGDASTGKLRARFATKGHNGIYVPLMAGGSGSAAFTGYWENTALFEKLRAFILANN